MYGSRRKGRWRRYTNGDESHCVTSCEIHEGDRELFLQCTQKHLVNAPLSHLADGLYHYEGSDEPDVDTGRPHDNVFEDNVVSDTATGIKMKHVDDIAFTGK